MTVTFQNRSHIKINVGGQLFLIRWSAVKKFPNSRLEQLCRAASEREILSLCDEYDAQTGECFFDRHAKSFEAVWNLYHSGEFYLETEMCAEHILDDLNYWGVSMSYMPFCCKYKFDLRKEFIEEEFEKVRHIIHGSEIKKSKSEAIFGKYRAKIWDVMEHPETSILARIMSGISIFVIVVSTLCLMVSTLPNVHRYAKISSHEVNRTIIRNSSKEIQMEKTQYDIFEIIEYICIIWFTIEYVLRLISVAQPLYFFTEFLNIIDFVAIAPFFLTLIVTSVYKSHNDKLESISKVTQVFRVLRILRVLKLARHSVGLQSLGYTLQRSYKELGLLVSFIAIGVTLFSSLIYFAEKEANQEMFPSIPHTFWWAIISMTTVGYGDVYPLTGIGQTLASICCVTGVLVIAMPIPIIVSNFSEFYKDKLRIEKTLKRKDEFEKAKNLGNYVTINTFAHSTLEPVLRIKDYFLTAKRETYHDIWNTTDWKYMDYSSSGCESVVDD